VATLSYPIQPFDALLRHPIMGFDLR